MATVHIIGAGISGLAAATALAEAHVPVKLYEASNAAGGRCRSSQDSTLGTVDHGLHTFSGAARELQKFIRRIEATEHFTRIRPPLVATDLRSGAQLRTSFLWFIPAPVADYLRFLGTVLSSYSVPLDASVGACSPLQDGIVQPLARLGLHQLPSQASSTQLRRLLLRHIQRGGHRWYMARHSLQESLIAPSLMRLEYLGGSVYFGQSLKALDMRNRTLTFARKKLLLEPEDVVIVATPSAVAKGFLPSLPTLPQHRAITLHFRCAHHAEPGTMQVLSNAPVDLLRYSEHSIGASIRVADSAWHGDDTLLAERVWRALQKLHPELREQAIPDWTIWREKRAGHVPQDEAITLPALPERCLLAGDWLDATRPATMEAAAWHGHRAARAALALMGKQPAPSQYDFYLN